MRNARFLVCALLVLGAVTGFAQKNKEQIKPKIVVGIVVDQMRWDYLHTYYDRFVSGGFKRLFDGGYSCENTFIPYVPTYTSAGHASVYTGSVPALHGIVANYWYNRHEKRDVYCTEDNSVKGVGSSSKYGRMSPKNLWATTVTDELRIASGFQSKVIGIAIKDRGAILPAGHSANAAYWFDNESGGFISSSYYMNDFPRWMSDFNNQKLADKYMMNDWNLLYPPSKYRHLNDDSAYFENDLPGGRNHFPHRFTQDKKHRYEAFKTSPFGNTLTFEAAKAAIEGEKLGSGTATDFLALSFSSTDYVGHTFGTQSLELQDTYLRLDKEMEGFLTYLDEKFGKDNYLIFLTSDHGVTHTAGFLNKYKLPGGALREHFQLKKYVSDIVKNNLKMEDAVIKITNDQIFLNRSLPAAELAVLKKLIIDSLSAQPYFSNVVDLERLSESSLPTIVKERILNGFNQYLSGDIQYVFRPGWYDYGMRGTKHGAWNVYDARIPLLFYGANIKAGKLYREVYMTDIAPTVAALLRVQAPDASIGRVIEEVVD